MSCKTFDALLAEIGQMDVGNVKVMEVCGTHTMAIAKSGLRSVLPPNIKLLSGPGCPVCVTPPQVIDQVLALPEFRQAKTIMAFCSTEDEPDTRLLLEQALTAGKRFPGRCPYGPEEQGRVPLSSAGFHGFLLIRPFL